ncbi:MAG: hypothetical protein FWH38_03005 [Treponema sp.]|nr:hypothetical protein [Treponema sp.]
METAAIPDYPRDITFEQVWASIMELRESQKETDRQIKETDRQMKETDRRLDARLGELGDRFGEMVERMVMPNLLEKFQELGFIFTKAYPHAVIKDEKNQIIAEIDITLENGDKVMIVEVKSKPTSKDITLHIKRMEKVRAHADLRNDRRKYLGAIAGMVMHENEKMFAFKNGFYVIEPSGNTFNIVSPEGGYSPREW